MKIRKPLMALATVGFALLMMASCAMFEKGPAKPVPSYKGQGGIYGDFIECCKTREKPFRNIETASHTMAVCHLGLIAYGLKRSLKWDQDTQEFPGDEQANRFLDRAKREPWVL